MQNTHQHSKDLIVSFEDDPRVLEEQRQTEYAGHIVPLGARVGRWQLSLSMSSLISGLFWLFYGALAGSLVGTQQAIIGLLVSLGAFILINWPLAKWGAKHGLDATLFSRRVFGVGGAVLISVITAANVTYYAVFESSVIAVALKSYFDGPALEYWYLIVVLVMLPLMRGGVQTWMGKLNGILLPLFVLGVVAAIISTGVNTNWSGRWLESEGLIPRDALGIPGWLFVAVLYMGAWQQMALTLEFSRFSRLEDLGFHRLVTFGPVFFVATYFINGLVGMYLVQATGLNAEVDEAGVVTAIMSALGFWGLIFIIVTQIRINTLNYYVASMYWQRLASSYLGLRFQRLTWVIIISALVYVLMLTNVFSYLQRALTWQGVFLVGWVGIVLTHFVFSRADRENGPEFRPKRLPRVTVAVPVWLIASAIGVYLAEHKAEFPVLSNLAPLVTLVASVVLYLIFRPAILKIGQRSGPDLHDEIQDKWHSHVLCNVCERSYTSLEMDRESKENGVVFCSACAEGAI